MDYNFTITNMRKLWKLFYTGHVEMRFTPKVMTSFQLIDSLRLRTRKTFQFLPFPDKAIYSFHHAKLHTLSCLGFPHQKNKIVLKEKNA